MGWRRPWDGRNGRAFERYKLEIDRRRVDGVDEEAGPDSGVLETKEDDARSDDNSEISDISLEGYDDYSTH